MVVKPGFEHLSSGPRRQAAIHTRPADPEALADLGGTDAVTMQPSHVSGLGPRCRRSTLVFPFRLGLGDALTLRSSISSRSRGAMQGSPIGQCPMLRPMSLRILPHCSGPLRQVPDHRPGESHRLFGGTAMSALGHKRTLASELEMSAYPSRADTLSGSIDAC